MSLRTTGLYGKRKPRDLSVLEAKRRKKRESWPTGQMLIG